MRCTWTWLWGLAGLLLIGCGEGDLTETEAPSVASITEGQWQITLHVVGEEEPVVETLVGFDVTDDQTLKATAHNDEDDRELTLCWSVDEVTGEILWGEVESDPIPVPARALNDDPVPVPARMMDDPVPIPADTSLIMLGEASAFGAMPQIIDVSEHQVVLEIPATEAPDEEDCGEDDQCERGEFITLLTLTRVD